MITIQTVRGLPTAPRDLTYKTHLKLAKQIWFMPSYVAGLKPAFTRQADLLDRMTSSLAQALKTDVNKSPGMALAESVVDQIVGITLDPRFVSDFLRVLDPDKTITFDIKDSETAAMLITDDGYNYVIMPLARDK